MLLCFALLCVCVSVSVLAHAAGTGTAEQFSWQFCAASYVCLSVNNENERGGSTWGVDMSILVAVVVVAASRLPPTRGLRPEVVCSGSEQTMRERNVVVVTVVMEYNK